MTFYGSSLASPEDAHTFQESTKQLFWLCFWPTPFFPPFFKMDSKLTGTLCTIPHFPTANTEMHCKHTRWTEHVGQLSSSSKRPEATVLPAGRTSIDISWFFSVDLESSTFASYKLTTQDLWIEKETSSTMKAKQKHSNTSAGASETALGLCVSISAAFVTAFGVFTKTVILEKNFKLWFWKSDDFFLSQITEIMETAQEKGLLPATRRTQLFRTLLPSVFIHCLPHPRVHLLEGTKRENKRTSGNTSRYAVNALQETEVILLHSGNIIWGFEAITYRNFFCAQKAMGEPFWIVSYCSTNIVFCVVPFRQCVLIPSSPHSMSHEIFLILIWAKKKK